MTAVLFQLDLLRKRSAVMYSPFAIMVHTINLKFMMFELLVNDMPVKESHLPFAVMWGLLYTNFAWGFNYYTGVW